MSYFPPPPEMPARVGLFRRVPPAVFSAMLGILGLSLAWRRAIGVFGLEPAPIETVLGAITLLFVFTAGAYAVKAAYRPGAVREDLATLPGRTGLSALAMCLMIEAAILAPYAPGLGKALLVLGFAGLAALAVYVLPARLGGNDPTGPVNPATHLVFVGFVVAPSASVLLGFAEAAMPWVVWWATAAALVIAAVTLGPLLTGKVPPPLRPLQTIQLGPPALIATGAVLTGQPVYAGIALAVATVVALILLLRLRWMIEAGFSGLWAAFTFPVAAYAGALLSVGYGLEMPALETAGGVVLVAATLYIPVIAYRVLKLWATGMLAAKTNASIA